MVIGFHRVPSDSGVRELLFHLRQGANSTGKCNPCAADLISQERDVITPRRSVLILAMTCSGWVITLVHTIPRPVDAHG